MAVSKFEEITNYQILQNGVQALATHPNTPSQYGVGGLTSQELKRWFDNLAILLADKINTIQNTLSSSEATKYIKVVIEQCENIDSLDDLIKSFNDGSFAQKILKLKDLETSETANKTIQSIIWEIKRAISELTETANAKISTISVNNVEQEIDENKNVNIDLTSYATKNELNSKAEAVHDHNSQYYTQRYIESNFERQGTVTYLSEKINKLSSIIKGKDQAISYNSYYDLAFELLQMDDISKIDDAKFGVGKSIYIVTKDVPDLWVVSIEEEYQDFHDRYYDYERASRLGYDASFDFDDNEVVADLESNETIQIGYFKLASLETLKQDLSGLLEEYRFILHEQNQNNPHSVTKSQVGLGNVNNTSDLNKPVSTAMQNALNGKSDKGHTHEQYATKDDLTAIAPTEHTHKMTDINGLQTALDVKAETNHEHEEYATQFQLESKADTYHTHSEYANQMATVEALMGKANTNHTHSNATTTKDGFMSMYDKTLLETIREILGVEADSNTVVDKINEVLAVFENYPEGDKIVEVLANKSNVEHTHSDYATKTELGNKADVSHKHQQYAMLEDLESLNSHKNSTSNPHSVTKSQIGLSNVANERQYSASNPPPYPLKSTSTGLTNTNGVVSVDANYINSLIDAKLPPNGNEVNF